MFSMSKKAVSLAVISILLTALAAETAHAQCEATETDTAVAPDGSFGDQFAYSVAIDGNVAVVGAPHDDDAGAQSGSGFVYTFDGTEWVQQPKLVAADSAAGDQFGWSVGISGPVAIFGAPTDTQAGPLSGSVYVFRFDGLNWNQEAKLVAPTPLQLFGWSVSVDGDVVVIGAPADSQAKGAAYVFRRNATQWLFEQKLTAFDATANDHFGEDVAISGDVVIVGAFEDDDTGTDCGSAYVFRDNGAVFAFEQKLVPPDIAAEDEFGKSLALDGSLAVVAAWAHDEGATDAGAVYIHRFDGKSWNPEQKLTASNAASGDRFGTSVDVSSDLVVIGAHGDSANGPGSGSAYVFMYDGFDWTEQAHLLPSNGAAFDDFGTSMGVQGGVAVAGAPSAAGTGSTTGAAYVYDGLSNGLPDACECPWDLDGGGVGATDLLAVLGAWGTDPGGGPDFDGDHDVNVLDLLSLLGHWGDCE